MVGGAGLFSDRKWSAFPSGTGLLKQNPHELNSYYTIIQHLKEAIPAYGDKLDKLLLNILEYIGDDNKSSEVVERKYLKLAQSKEANVKNSLDINKKYKSLVLDNLTDATNILRYFSNLIDEKDILYNHLVHQIKKGQTDEHGKCDYVIGCYNYTNKQTCSIFNF